MTGRPVDPWVSHCLDLLAPLGDVRARAMFGGWGLSLDGLNIAIIIDDRLYLKTDGATREAFASAGGEPFRYTDRNGRTAEMSYWTPPDEALETPHELLPWGRLAVEAARRAPQRKKKKEAAPA